MKEKLLNPVEATSDENWSNGMSDDDRLLIVFSLYCYLQIEGKYNMFMDAMEICLDYHICPSDYLEVLDNYEEFLLNHHEIYNYHESEAMKQILASYDSENI